jgi:hypothetical protein
MKINLFYQKIMITFVFMKKKMEKLQTILRGISVGLNFYLVPIDSTVVLYYNSFEL